METHIKLRKKGFNYYTDYTEKYLDEALNAYGYKLSLRKENGKGSLTLFWDESPWLTVSAPWFDEMSEEKVKEVAENLAKKFKTVYEITSEEPKEKFEERHEYYITDGVGAIDEPFFITEGEPCFEWVTMPFRQNYNKPYHISFQNYGGIKKGLVAEITVKNKNAEIKDFELRKMDSNGDFEVFKSEPIVAENENDKIYRFEFPEYVIPEGINRYSIKLMAKKKQTECEKRRIFISFLPVCDYDETADVTEEIMVSLKGL